MEHVFTGREIAAGKYLIAEVSDDDNPIIPRIKDVPEIITFEKVRVYIYLSNNFKAIDKNFFKKMYAVFAFKSMLDFVRSNRVFSQEQESVIQKLEEIYEILKDQYEKSKNVVTTVDSNNLTLIPKEFVDRQEEILKYELDRALYCCYLSTQRKISISYFFI
ncbi:MAG: hypothetical protein LBJ93_00705, partial [Clostridiales bacterium]|nr:hypothetical protein [Clostridiales bacterium]